MLVSEDRAAELGTQAFHEVLTQTEVVDTPALTAPVDRVGRALAAVAEEPSYAWRFAVLEDDDTANAFALPGGKVGVYTGLFPIADTNHGLAVVMAHEIAHVLARHGSERMSQNLIANLGGTVLGAALGGGPSTQAVLTADGLGTQFGVLLPFNRTQEAEADRIGLMLMARAGYDPRAALDFWQRMERARERGAPPELLSTHPSHETRIDEIRRFLPQASARFQDASTKPVRQLPAVASG
jgi:predicted Zn-dependent protease